MQTDKNGRGIGSFDEWTRLRETIVGAPILTLAESNDFAHTVIDTGAPNSSFHLPYYEPNAATIVGHGPPASDMARYLDELREDIEGFILALEERDVLIHRATVLPRPIRVTTPYWMSGFSPALNVRDQALVLGDEIIETSPQVRSRYFENDLLKKIFYDHFYRGAKWTVMPRPILSDQSFDLGRSSSVYPFELQDPRLSSRSPFDVGIEMMIDGAQCLRFGGDVLVNIANKSHELGLEWLKRHTDRFRFHALTSVAAGHLDSTLMPLRPGLLLVRHQRVVEALPVALRQWRVVVAPEPDLSTFPTYTSGTMLLASKFVDMNVLSLDENTVVVNSLNPSLCRVLEDEGFDVVPVRHRHRRLFGGGFHCFTLDTVRDGRLEDYFN